VRFQNSANHNTVAYCNFDQGRNVGWSGSQIYGNSLYNWVHHCRLSKYGYFTTDDIGSVLDIGDEKTLCKPIPFIRRQFNIEELAPT
jgi:hypothetical protein